MSDVELADDSSVNSDDVPEELPEDVPIKGETSKRIRNLRKKDARQKGHFANAKSCGITKTTRSSFAKDLHKSMFSDTAVKKMARFCPQNASEVGSTPTALWQETCELQHVVLSKATVRQLKIQADAFQRNVLQHAAAQMYNSGASRIEPWHIKVAVESLAGVMRNSDFLLPRSMVRNAQTKKIKKGDAEVPILRTDAEDHELEAEEKRAGRVRKEIYNSVNKAALAAKKQKKNEAGEEAESAVAVVGVVD